MGTNDFKQWKEELECRALQRQTPVIVPAQPHAGLLLLTVLGFLWIVGTKHAAVA